MAEKDSISFRTDQASRREASKRPAMQPRHCDFPHPFRHAFLTHVGRCKVASLWFWLSLSRTCHSCFERGWGPRHVWNGLQICTKELLSEGGRAFRSDRFFAEAAFLQKFPSSENPRRSIVASIQMSRERVIRSIGVEKGAI